MFGGVNAPYIWVKAPKGVTSWQVFDKILGEANVVITPGSGHRARKARIGLRISAFNSQCQCRGSGPPARGVKVVKQGGGFQPDQVASLFVNIVVWITLVLVLARLAMELWLAWLNRRHVLACAAQCRRLFHEIIDEPTY